MIVLGINHSNDAATAVARDGRVIAASAEERFSRIKHDGGFPHQAMGFSLGEVGCGLEECDAVAFFWNPVQQMDAPHGRLVSKPRHHLEYLFSLPNQLLAGRDLLDVPFVELKVPLAPGHPLRLFYVDHHLCHAAHAFYESPFDQAAILTVDGYGERVSTLIGKGSGRNIEHLLKIPFPHSVGSVYAALTQYLGFRANAHEGKVMGLSSYGTPRQLDLFRKLLGPTPDGFQVDLSYFDYYRDGRHRFGQRLVDELGPPRAPEAAIEPRHEDIAASLQAATEEVLIHLARLARQKSGCSDLCMAGGVALNCVANGRIVTEAGFDRCFFQPACHDAGTSAGAALYVTHTLLGREREPLGVKTDYLGPQFDADALREVLDRAGARFREPANIADEAAERLARGRIIGRFEGRAEFGPRALGNRSILAAPGPAPVKDVLNKRVKGREPFRPFAPSVLESHCGDYFDSAIPSPFMLRVYKTKPEHIERMGAITHVDGTARVQTVNQATKPRL